MAHIDWRLRGAMIDLCNCDYGCPCQFNARPTTENTMGAMAIPATVWLGTTGLMNLLM